MKDLKHRILMGIFFTEALIGIGAIYGEGAAIITGLFIAIVEAGAWLFRREAP